MLQRLQAWIVNSRQIKGVVTDLFLNCGGESVVVVINPNDLTCGGRSRSCKNSQKKNQYFHIKRTPRQIALTSNTIRWLFAVARRMTKTRATAGVADPRNIIPFLFGGRTIQILRSRITRRAFVWIVPLSAWRRFFFVRGPTEVPFRARVPQNEP